ncbi:MAG: TonB-dependent receptor [Acidobacteria bacterium]|nr:TonB-dependent receptor [Acidobacteriota bacterium]
MLRLILAVVLMASQAYGQLSSASVTGTVYDSAGAVAPGVEIRLHNLQTGVERSSLSNETGNYVFLNVPPGEYRIEARKAGFRQIRTAQFVLEVNRTATFDLTLEVGQIEQTVNVAATAVELQASTAELGTVVESKQVLDLPLNGRNFTQLLALSPGASPISVGQNAGGGQATAVGQVTYPSINGQSNRSNLFFLDGLSNIGVFMSTYAVPPIVDAVQEFKVQSHNDQAEFGMSTGGAINVVTKSGTNRFHASAWEFLRNDALDARNPFRTIKTPLRQDMFGTTLGGPVVLPGYRGQNRTFFFLSYQGFRNRTPANSLYRVPTEANLRGDLSDWPRQIFDPFSTRANPDRPGTFLRTPFTGNQLPGSRLDAGWLAYLKATVPGAITTGVADRNQLDFTPTVINQEEYSGRFDHTFSAKDFTWFRWSGQFYDRTGSGGRQTLTSFEEYFTVNAGGSWVHTFSPTSVLQTQIGYTVVQRPNGSRFRDGIDAIGASGVNREFCCAFRSGAVIMPNINVAQFFSGGEVAGYSHPTEVTSYKSNYSQIRGRHEWKFGGEFSHNKFLTLLSDHGISFDSPTTADPNNQAQTGSPLASFLLNVPFGADRRDFAKYTRFGGILGFYAQDSWKVTPRLTLNLGLRYDYTKVPPIGRESDRTIATGNMDLIRGRYLLQAIPKTCAEVGTAPCLPSATLPANVELDARGRLVSNFTDNWQPRIGVAYKLGQNMVVRGSFGLFFDSWAGITQFSQGIGHTWPDVGRRLSTNFNVPTAAAPTPVLSGKNPFPSATTPAATPFNDGAFFIDPFFRNSKSAQWNIGLQRQIAANELIAVNYVGSANTRLPIGGFYNVAVGAAPGNAASRRPFPFIMPANFDRSWGRGNYHSLQAQWRRRFSAGLSYLINYTWSKSITIGCDGFFGVEGCSVQNPYNFNNERSVSATDLPHILNSSVTYDLPFGRTGPSAARAIAGGWQLNAIMTLHSGQPFTVNMNGDIANTGNQNGYMRPNVIGAARLDTPSPSRWFNTAAFAAPAAFTFGNAGRNILRGDGNVNFDLSLFRSFRIPLREASRLQIRAEAFNAFNHIRYANPVANLTNPNFGQVLGTASRERQIQLGAKIEF